MTDKKPLLSIKNLSVNYGAIRALKKADLEVHSGEIVAVIGANGAGKSTLMNAIMGDVPRAGGEILLDGAPLPRKSYQVVMAGVSLSPEGRKVFAPLTVYENLQMGAFPIKGHSALEEQMCKVFDRFPGLEERREQLRKLFRRFTGQEGSGERPGALPIKNSCSAEEQMRKVFNLFPRLEERKEQYAGTLSGGEQQMLAIGRALMAEPRVLLLDEPSLGLAPIIINEIFKELTIVNKQLGMTILIVEQNARKALLLSHRAYVIQTGEIVMEGRSEDLLHNPEIEAAYLGGKK